MRSVILWALLGGAAITALYCWNRTLQSPDLPIQRAGRVIEPAPICPWRNPEADLARFFPSATGWQSETHVLSGRRLELQQRLGRWPEADENSLRLYRIQKDSVALGAILTRRVKGEHGAIELSLAVDTNDVVRGIALQRIREPDEVSSALSEPAWLAAFNGKTADADWQLGHAVPNLPPQAAVSGRSIVEGVRSLLILKQLASESNVAHAHHTPQP